MKHLILLTIALLTGYSQFVSGQSDDCAKCGQRMIKCWDLNIYTTKPVTSADSTLWKQLHYASEGYIGRFTTVESSQCLAFLPACRIGDSTPPSVSYTHLRAHETPEHLVCRLLLEKKKKKKKQKTNIL